MTPEETKNLETIKKTYVALQQNLGMDVFTQDFADDCQLHEAASLPYGGMWVGPVSIGKGVQHIFSAFEDFDFVILNYLTGGDEVVVHVMLSGKSPKTGKVFSMPLLEKWRLRDGKIIEVRPFYFDTARVNECFGG